MNPCRKWNENLLDLALEGLEPSQARAVEAHVQGCSACAAKLSELRARAETIDAALRQFVRQAQPSPAFAAGVRARLEAGPAPMSWRRLSRIGALAAVTICIVIAAVLLRPSPGKLWPGLRRQAPKPVTAISAWRSPTENLLHSSANELLQSTPRLGQFYFRLEPVTRDPGKANGGNRNET